MEKYNSGKGFNGRAGNYVANIFPVEVKHIGKLTITNQELENFTDETGAPLTSDNIRIIKKSLERYNSDEHAIKVAIKGSKFDGDVEDGVYTKKKLAQLPNCFPLLPKHINFVPKIGEMVLVMVESAEDVFNDRYYVGPLTSSLTKMDKDLSSTALSNRSYGITEATEEISKIHHREPLILNQSQINNFLNVKKVSVNILYGNNLSYILTFQVLYIWM